MSVRQDKARKTWMAKVSYMDDLGVRRYKTISTTSWRSLFYFIPACGLENCRP